MLTVLNCLYLFKDPKQRLKTFGSFMTEPRPASDSALSLVRDAIAQLPDGVGSVTDVSNLLRYSQNLSSKNFSKIIDIVVYCMSILVKEPFPCVSFNEDINSFLICNTNSVLKNTVSLYFVNCNALK